METIEQKPERPKGCYFDVYGWDEEKLKNLTCKNCPLPAMVCDYKGWAVMEQIAERMKSDRISIVSKP